MKGILKSMRNSNNLAYDFERFETRVPKKKQQEQPAIRIVKDNQKKYSYCKSHSMRQLL